MTSDPTALLLATAFSIFGALCVVLVLVGLPGAWLLIATAIAIDCLDWIWLAPNAPLTFHPLTIVVAILIATAGEAMEFALSAAGAKRFGASRAGMIGAMIGGAIGAIGGTVLIPIPVIGTLMGAMCATAAGAIIGELNARKPDGKATSLRDTVAPATGAVLGRVLGTLAKLPIAVIVAALLAIAAYRV
jgi:hypothetical protein